MRRRGLTLIEILVVLAVTITLLALIVPQVVDEVRNAGTSAVANALTTVANGAGSFKADVRRYPGQIRFLTDTTSATPTDICGNTIPAVLRGRWAGPYLQSQVSASGIVAGDATLLDALGRDPASGDPASLVIIAVGVDQRSATDLEEQFDGDANFSAGTIRWTGAGVDTLKYYMPISGC
jgi:type II secretory pathway pseudopilin PulG